MIRDPRVVFDQLFGVGATPAERAERRTRGRSILDWITASVDAAEARARPGRSRAARPTTSTTSARSSGASRTSRRATRSGEPRELPERAGRRARFVRRARQADVRSAGARVRVRHHARVLVQAGARRVEPRRIRRAASRPAFHNASHHQEKRRSHPRLREDQQVPRQHDSVLPREAEEHAGRRRQPARQHAGASTARRWATRTCTTTSACRCSSPATPAAQLKGDLHVKAPDGTPMANVDADGAAHARPGRSAAVRRQHAANWI